MSKIPHRKLLRFFCFESCDVFFRVNIFDVESCCVFFGSKVVTFLCVNIFDVESCGVFFGVSKVAMFFWGGPVSERARCRKF